MDSSQIRDVSKRLFGNSYRLEIAAAIHENSLEAVSAIGLHHQTGIFYARVQGQLKALQSAGLLHEIEGDSRLVEYKVQPSVFWEFARAFLSELRGT